MYDQDKTKEELQKELTKLKYEFHYLNAITTVSLKETE